MKELDYIDFHERAAKEFDKDKKVISVAKAKAAIKKAYERGFVDGKSFSTAIS